MGLEDTGLIQREKNAPSDTLRALTLDNTLKNEHEQANAAQNPFVQRRNYDIAREAGRLTADAADRQERSIDERLSRMTDENRRLSTRADARLKTYDHMSEIHYNVSELLTNVLNALNKTGTKGTRTYTDAVRAIRNYRSAVLRLDGKEPLNARHQGEEAGVPMQQKGNKRRHYGKRAGSLFRGSFR